MLRRISFPGWRLIAPVFAVVILLLMLAACGAEDAAPTARPATVAPVATPVPTTVPPTAVPPTPEPPAPRPTVAAMPAETPEPTVAPPAPALSLSNGATPQPPAPEPTATPTPHVSEQPEPTAAPEATETPVATEPAGTPEPTATPFASREPCEGERGGEVGNCAPEFAGTQGWVNSDPFTMESRLGRVVLIDFWTYSCINCIRTLPFLQTWHERYADEGLVIVGVHTPEFEFEKVYDNVVDATVDMGVAWPVVQDNDYAVWSSYSNRFWPAKYLIDKDGVIRYRHFGEGKYAETEEEIRKLLAEIGADEEMLAQPLPEDQSRDSAYLSSDTRQTPELFAGWVFVNSHYQAGRGLYVGQFEPYWEAAQASYRAGDQKGAVADFVIEGSEVVVDRIYFQGPWAVGPEYVRHARETDDIEQDYVLLPYSSRSVNAVLSSESGDPYRVVVKLNNEYLTEENKGLDITIGDDGVSYLTVDSARAYYLVEHPEWQENQYIQMFSNSDDFSLFSFTFGTYEDGF